MCLSWICCGPCKLTYLLVVTVCGWTRWLLQGVCLMVCWPFTDVSQEGRQPSGTATDAFLRC